MRTTQIVEAVLFSSDAPLRSEEIARADESLNEDVVEKCIKELTKMYLDAERAFEIKQIAGGYQILTLSVYAPYLERFDTVPKSSRLSMPALETLAIIAYRQPIGRIDIEYIRGVSSAGVIRTLQDRELVDVIGRGDGLGRPLLYGTTKKFLEHFGFSDLEDLPRTEDLPVILKGEDIPDSVGSVISEELETKNNEEVITTGQKIDDLAGGDGVIPLSPPVE
jgi:segregation and condensation protein B